MLTAITRAVSPSINQCELTFLERQEVDVVRAEEQHRKYEECLRELGVHVISLPRSRIIRTRCSWKIRRWWWTKRR